VFAIAAALIGILLLTAATIIDESESLLDARHAFYS
jgi:hypothetical protein